MASQMTVPVTPKLASELAGTATLLAKLDDPSQPPGHKVNDNHHFVKVVDQLEALALSVLAATSCVPLTVRTMRCAHFDMGSDSNLHRHVVSCVAYLRDTASEALHAGGYDRYRADLVNVALGFLRQLEGMLRSAVVKAAEADLARLSGLGVNELLAAAEALAKASTLPLPARLSKVDAPEPEPWDATKVGYTPSTGVDFPDGRK